MKKTILHCNHEDCTRIGCIALHGFGEPCLGNPNLRIVCAEHLEDLEAWNDHRTELDDGDRFCIADAEIARRYELAREYLRIARKAPDPLRWVGYAKNARRMIAALRRIACTA